MICFTGNLLRKRFTERKETVILQKITLKNVVEELNGQTTKTVVILLRTVRIYHSPERTRTEKGPREIVIVKKLDEQMTKKCSFQATTSHNGQNFKFRR